MVWLTASYCLWPPVFLKIHSLFVSSIPELENLLRYSTEWVENDASARSLNLTSAVVCTLILDPQVDRFISLPKDN